jgi:hypothetical protein
MNKVVSICGLILCSSFGISLKAKADPRWTGMASCPANTWAIGVKLALLNGANDPARPAVQPEKGFSGAELTCADIDKSSGSIVTVSPDFSGLGQGQTWDHSVTILPAGGEFFTKAEFYLWHQDGSFGLAGANFTSNFGTSHKRTWSENFQINSKICDSGEAINGIRFYGEFVFSIAEVTCSSFQTVIDARNAALADLNKVNRLESLKKYAELERVSVDNDVKAASIHKISFETLNLNITGAACAIDELSRTVYITSTLEELDSFVDLFSKTFGHNDWRSHAVNCENSAQSIASYTGCIDGSLDAICLNRSGYLEIKSRLENKLVDYTKYRDEANAIGNGNVCLDIERLSQQALIDVGSDLAAKTAAGALSGTCTGAVIYIRNPVAETFPILVPGGSGSGTATAGGVVTP